MSGIYLDDLWHSITSGQFIGLNRKFASYPGIVFMSRMREYTNVYFLPSAEADEFLEIDVEIDLDPTLTVDLKQLASFDPDATQEIPIDILSRLLQESTIQ